MLIDVNQVYDMDFKVDAVRYRMKKNIIIIEGRP